MDAQFFPWMGTGTDAIEPSPAVSRPEAIQCGAVTNIRNLICGTIGRLPMYAMNSAYVRASRPLLDQPERDVPRSITMTNTLDDLLFYGIAWWRVLERDRGGRGFPTRVARLDPPTVDVKGANRIYVKQDGSAAGSRWEWVSEKDMIRFDSPNDALLIAGARAIRTCLRLDAAAASRAEDPIPQGILEYKDGVEVDWAGPVLEAETAEEYEARANAAKQAWQDNWKLARQGYSTPLLPAFLGYNVIQDSAKDIQLAEARQHAVLEIARVAGVDGAFVGSIAPGTSNTYSNQQDKRRDLIEFVLADYMVAVQDVLSMDHVSPHGTLVRFDPNGFLRSNEKERMETHEVAIRVGAYDEDEMRRREELPTPANPTPAQVRPLRSVPEEPVAATGTAGHTFSADALIIGFEGSGGENFEVDRESRIISGLCAPYGVLSTTKGGRKYRFSNGSIRWTDPGRVKLLGGGHDNSLAVAKAIHFESRPEGLWGRFKVARGEAGERALSMAEDGVWDGLSVGLREDAEFANNGGVMDLVAGDLAHVALTPDPAFTDARVSAVAFDTKGTTMPETGTDTAPPPDTAPAIQFDATPIAEAIRLGFESLSAPAVVSASRPTPMQVNELGPYAFDGDTFREGGQFEFSTDLREYVDRGPGHGPARDRVLAFMADQMRSDRTGAPSLNFDVDTADANEANPTIQRPDLFVDQRSFQYPLWTAVKKETLSKITPSTFPKYSSSSGLVAAHVEGTEPAAGTYVLTGDTITPGAHSGKVEITRELWDQVGTPRVASLIWAQMLKGWFESLEAKVVTVLDAASPTGITLTTAAEDTDLADEITDAFVALQYTRGGFSMDTFALQVDLYKKLAKASDDDGRRIYPQLGPANANGTMAPRNRSINVDGVLGIPAWALAATGTVAASSYLFDSDAVYAAASTPDRLEWDFGGTVQTNNLTQIAYRTLGIWGYSVVMIRDLTGVREVIYDPAA